MRLQLMGVVMVTGVAAVAVIEHTYSTVEAGMQTTTQPITTNDATKFLGCLQANYCQLSIMLGLMILTYQYKGLSDEVAIVPVVLASHSLRCTEAYNAHLRM